MIAIALFFPSGEDGDTIWVPMTEARLAKAGQSTTSAGSNENSAWYSGGHSLKRQRDGHFYASGIVDGASVEFLVDTGASIVALTGSDALAAGLSWSESEIRQIGTGASGAVYGVPIYLSQIEVGSVTQHNVRAVIIPRGLEISLLGQSFLSDINSVEIVGDEMIWKAG